MDNLFANTNSNIFNNQQQDKNIEKKITNNSNKNDIQDAYEKIFIEAAESIRREIDKIKPEKPCASCNVKDCKIEKKDIFTKYPANCKYRDWQLQVLTFLAGDYMHKLKKEYNEMMNKKENYTCGKCGACCKLAVSNNSYTQMQQRASRGDKFAMDFVSIYLPYENEDVAKQSNPEYFEKLNQLVSDDKIYYYYCSKLKDNLCTIYEKRPDICHKFPNNPLKLLPKDCTYNAWKDEISHQAMLLNAKADIIKYYNETLK